MNKKITKDQTSEMGPEQLLYACMRERKLCTALNQTGFGLSERETMTSSLRCHLTVEINESVEFLNRGVEAPQVGSTDMQMESLEV